MEDFRIMPWARPALRVSMCLPPGRREDYQAWMRGLCAMAAQVHLPKPCSTCNEAYCLCACHHGCACGKRA